MLQSNVRDISAAAVVYLIAIMSNLLKRSVSHQGLIKHAGNDSNASL